LDLPQVKEMLLMSLLIQRITVYVDIMFLGIKII